MLLSCLAHTCRQKLMNKQSQSLYICLIFYCCFCFVLVLFCFFAFPGSVWKPGTLPPRCRPSPTHLQLLLSSLSSTSPSLAPPRSSAIPRLPQLLSWGPSKVTTPMMKTHRALHPRCRAKHHTPPSRPATAVSHVSGTQFTHWYSLHFSWRDKASLRTPCFKLCAPLQEQWKHCSHTHSV